MLLVAIVQKHCQQAEQGKSKKGMGRKAKKESVGFNRNKPYKAEKGTVKKGSVEDRKTAQTLRIRCCAVGLQ